MAKANGSNRARPSLSKFVIKIMAPVDDLPQTNPSGFRGVVAPPANLKRRLQIESCNIQMADQRSLPFNPPSAIHNLNRQIRIARGIDPAQGG